MARSHHRKKHKSHLRQYQQNHDADTAKISKAKVSTTFTVIGIILGAAIGYFASDGTPVWIAGIAVAGGILGYFTGRYFDREKK